MTINNATVEQINVALLDIDKRIKALNIDSETLKSLQNSVKSIKGSLNGTTTGMAKALTVNGKTYDGSEAVNAGVQLVENGGTSSTNAEDGFNTLADGVRDSSTPGDDEKLLLKPSGTWYKTTCLDFWNYIKNKISSVLGLTKDNYGGTADYANVPTGFDKIDNQDFWGNQDGVSITDWATFRGEDGTGDIAFRLNKGQLNLIIDGVFYQNEGRYKLVDENSLKNIMKPNYTTGRLPAGVYKTGQTVSVSASITTTRGNPVYISYSGDFNSVNPGSTVPWVSFFLYVDGQIVQRTVVDDSVALASDNTPFAGNALAVLSAGSHTIRLDAVLAGDTSGQVQFQEQENFVNLVAFEL